MKKDFQSRAGNKYPENGITETAAKDFNTGYG